jgi:GGDEF domain-containing protein
VADAPVDAMLDRVDDLTKGWLLELVDAAPLAHAPAILAGELATIGPRLCAAASRALAADRELAAIEHGGPLEPLAAQVGRIAGAVKLADVSGAVDALMGVLWSAIRSELQDPEAELVSELAERLAYVIEAIRGAALADFARRMGEDREPVEPDSARVPDPPRGPEPPPVAAAWPASPGRTRTRDSPRAPEPTRLSESMRAPEANGVKESVEAQTPTPTPPPAPGAAPAPGDVEPRAREAPRRHLDEMSADGRIRSWPGGLEAPERPRAVRSEALWIGAIDDEIERAENSGAALSLLLVELEDAERVLAVEDPSEASMTFRRFAQAVRTVVRRQDILACESDSRAWIIAPGSNRTAAQALGARIEDAVRAEPPWRGAPMTISVGLSVLGEDGRDSATLMDVAEEARFAATAGGGGVQARDPAATETAPRGGPHSVG